MKNQAIIIGRFQASEISVGLRQFFHEIEKEDHLLGIILGEAKLPVTKNNPFDIKTRSTLLHKEFPSLQILSIEDVPSDEQWSDQLDRLIGEHFPGQKIILIGSPDGFTSRYHGKFRTKSSSNAFKTDIDVARMESEAEHSRDFRRGVEYAMHKSYAKVYPTVDIALFRKHRSELLMGLKEADQKWRLIGGFADPTDNSYEDAVRRELKEETGISEFSNLTYESSFLVDDWRYRYEVDKIISSLFSAEYISGEPIGSDDISQVRWISLDQVRRFKEENRTAPEHGPLLNFLLEKYRQ